MKEKTNNFKLYKIKEDYINYLGNYDHRVPNNKNQKRPYIGIILIGENKNFFIPLASPKPKHIYMPDKMIDIYKIDNGRLGILNINNMIPIFKGEVILFDIILNETDNKDEANYKRMLQNQLIELNNNKQKIVKKAEYLYKQYINNNLPSNIVNRCCNFKLLEKKCKEWEANINNI
jgi:hypothetical protein